MYISSNNLYRLIASPHPFFALRQGIGILLPVIVLIGILDERPFGFAFTIGSLAVALIDQPGGTKLFRLKEMLFVLIAGNLAVLITGLAKPFPWLIWIVITAQTFLFSMLSVFGKRGGLVGFACMLMMLLSLNIDLHSEHILYYSLITFSGSCFYLALNIVAGYIFSLHEERLTLAAAVHATADYIKIRANFYDINQDLDKCFSKLLTTMITMTDNHQSARNLILRGLPEDNKNHQHDRIALWNVLIETQTLLDTMVATQTDYTLLRERFKDHDILLFMRDTLLKLSKTLQRCAVKLAHHSPVFYRNSVKAELRAIEYEIEKLKLDGIQQKEPEVYSLIVQILRRLRNATRSVDIIADNLRTNKEVKPINTMRRDTSLLQFRTHQSLRLQPILNNLHFGSAIFRYALRVTLAIVIVQLITTVVVMTYPNDHIITEISPHSYWITMTILLTMRPGFALTRQRTMMRLKGTAWGCLIALGILSVTTNWIILLLVLIVSMLLGQMLIVNYFRLGSLLLTVYILIGFHFLSPNIFAIIGERAADTFIGCLLAFICSFAFPWWEENQIKRLATAAIHASQHYLSKEFAFVRSAISSGLNNATYYPNDPNFVPMQLARQHMHDTYATFADSYARMLNEPKSHHINISNINNLVMSINTMTSQTKSLSPMLLSLDTISPELSAQLDYINQLLSTETMHATHEPPAPPALENTIENQPFMLPLKQIRKAALSIRQEVKAMQL